MVDGKAVVGTESDDVFSLTGATRVISTLGGNDIVVLKDPVDSFLTAYLGAGDDMFRVSQSAASARSGAKVTVLAGDGNDLVYGTAQGDFLAGGAGDDEIHGSARGASSSLRDDLIYGGDGNDRLYGAGNIYGDAGNDYLRADRGRGSGTVSLFGGTGNDVLDANLSGRSTALYGGSGADIFVANGGTIMDFTPGEGDRIDLSFHVSAIVSHLSGAAGELMVVKSGGQQGGYRVYTMLADGSQHRLTELPHGLDLAHLSTHWFL